MVYSFVNSLSSPKPPFIVYLKTERVQKFECKMLIFEVSGPPSLNTHNNPEPLFHNS